MEACTKTPSLPGPKGLVRERLLHEVLMAWSQVLPGSTLLNDTVATESMFDLRTAGPSTTSYHRATRHLVWKYDDSTVMERFCSSSLRARTRGDQHRRPNPLPVLGPLMHFKQGNSCIIQRAVSSDGPVRPVSKLVTHTLQACLGCRPCLAVERCKYRVWVQN